MIHSLNIGLIKPTNTFFFVHPKIPAININWFCELPGHHFVYPTQRRHAEVENWFLAARRRHPLMVAWRDLYNAGWEDARRCAASVIFWEAPRKTNRAYSEWKATLEIPRNEVLKAPDTKCEARRL